MTAELKMNRSKETRNKAPSGQSEGWINTIYLTIRQNCERLVFVPLIKNH